MRHPNSGLPEFGIMIIQVGNSRLGCADPESRRWVCFWIPGSLALLAPRNDGVLRHFRLESSRRAIVARLRNAALTLQARTGVFLVEISNEGILVILFVGLVAGWLAGKIVRGTGFGIIGDILIGIAGALVASYLFPRLGIHLGTGMLSKILYSAIGAILLLLIVRLVRTGGRF
jgi:uncharacterized membrane protein YeaQ/YmgE (transglycosylase-associated protein family)